MMIKFKQLSQSIRLVSKVRRMKPTKNSQAGFTIIESLAAIVVVAILLAAIAPVLVLSVATRVQARRIELGSLAATSYLDGVRSGAITPPNRVIQLNSTNYASNFQNFAKEPAPNVGIYCTTQGYCTNSTTLSLYCIDRDGSGCSVNSHQDFVIQAFRATTDPTVTNLNEGYLLVVRVYRADAFVNDGKPLLTKAANNARQETLTGGLGNSKAPSIEIPTEVASQATQYSDYCNRLGGCQSN